MAAGPGGWGSTRTNPFNKPFDVLLIAHIALDEGYLACAQAQAFLLESVGRRRAVVRQDQVSSSHRKALGMGLSDGARRP